MPCLLLILCEPDLDCDRGKESQWQDGHLCDHSITGSPATIHDDENGLCSIRWKNNSVVTCISNAHGSYPMTRAQRKIKGDKVNVEIPYMISQYNAHMSGIDLSDWKT